MGKSKKRAREKAKEHVLSLDGSAATKALSVAGTEPRKIAKLSLKAAQANPKRAHGPSVNLVEVDGKTCTHEVAWPPALEDPAISSGMLPLPILNKPLTVSEVADSNTFYYVVLYGVPAQHNVIIFCFD